MSPFGLCEKVVKSRQDDLLSVPVPANLVQWLLIGVAVLVGLNWFGYFFADHMPLGTAKVLARRFSLDLENTPAAWFSAAMLLLAAGLMWSISLRGQETNDRFRRHWLVLAVIFVVLSLDEASSFHEMLIIPLRERLNLGGIFYYAWVLPAMVFCAVVAVAYLPMLVSLPPTLRNRLLIAGGLYVGGALGMEMVGGAMADSGFRGTLAYVTVTTVEETMEMLGAVVLIHALMAHLRAGAPATAARPRQERVSSRPAQPALRTAFESRG